jgi:alkylated DNA repair dioxygenase AlkB
MKFNVSNILPYDGEAYLLKGAFKEVDDHFQSLLTDTSWHTNTIKIFGKEILEPRMLTFMADDGVTYTYSGQQLPVQSWSPLCMKLRTKLLEQYKLQFNSALLNYYQNGKSYMGYHQDNEKELGEDPNIASISVGASRDFIFKHKKSGEKVYVHLDSGDLVLMIGGTCQKNWCHALPKRLKVSDPRVNITFRQIIS